MVGGKHITTASIILKNWTTAAAPLIQEFCRSHGPVRRPLDQSPMPKNENQSHLKDQLAYFEN